MYIYIICWYEDGQTIRQRCSNANTSIFGIEYFKLDNMNIFFKFKLFKIIQKELDKINFKLRKLNYVHHQLHTEKKCAVMKRKSGQLWFYHSTVLLSLYHWLMARRSHRWSNRVFLKWNESILNEWTYYYMWMEFLSLRFLTILNMNWKFMRNNAA